jgi:predicted PP-loop superfamily ATPase
MKREHWLSVIVPVADQVHRLAADINRLGLQRVLMRDFRAGLIALVMARRFL